MRRIMKEQMIEKFILHLKQEEKSHSTIQKYLHDIQCFSQFANCRKIDKSLVLAYKASFCYEQTELTKEAYIRLYY